MEDILIVDGYNVIGAWPKLQELKAISLEEARIELIKMMAEYQGAKGITVIIVFDAHQVRGPIKEYRDSRVKVLFTSENETADELIEKLAAGWRSKRRNIFVATSDWVEQSVIFGQGAYRISARELHLMWEEAKQKISRETKDKVSQKTTIDLYLTPEQLIKLERMRREK